MLGNIDKFIKNRLTYLRMTSLILKLINYSNDQSYEFRKDLEKSIINSREDLFYLPSGLTGNSLALALELGYYDGALLMIIDATRLGINIDECAFDEQLLISYSAKEMFEHVSRLDEEVNADLEETLFESKKEVKDTIRKVLV